MAILKGFTRSTRCWLLVAVLAVIYVVVGPWWVGNEPYINSDYYKKTLLTLNNTSALESNGELYVGYAQKKIETKIGQPIMGFTDRKPLGSQGELSPSYAKSLTVKVGDKAVSIVAVDVMILLGRIVDDVYTETGLARDEIFFTATHTHSGVGGWYDDLFFEMFYGKYKYEYYDNLKKAIVDSIMNSRKEFTRAKMSLVRVDGSEWLENRIYSHSPPKNDLGFHDVNPYLSALSFVDYENPHKILYILTAFAAHPTVIRKNVHEFSSDYPGYLCSEIKKETGAKGVMFAAGSVGDARAVVLHEDGAIKLAVSLGDMVSKKIVDAKYKDVDSLYSRYLPIEMPEARFTFLGARWSFFPLAARYLFDKPVHISFLKLNDFTMVGMPVDIAGELTAEVESEKPVLITSFNGSWKGYATKEDTYLSRDTYSTREMGLAGAQAGAFLMDIAEQINNNSN